MNLQRRSLPDPDDLAGAIAAHDRGAVATALNMLDDRRPEARKCASRMLATLPSERLDAGAHLIGVTGPPGAGKSSLTAALIQVWRTQGKRIGILAVDPSSPLSGGALLGDRLRMMAGEGIADHSVFVRSLASRGEYGGLSAEVWPMSLVMLAAFDIVLIETVGVGQREVDVSKLSDTTVFVAQPASGDSIQFLKAGIMEVPHVLVVNKADMGAPARRTLAELKTTLGSRTDTEGWEVPAVAVSATTFTGIEALIDTIETHRVWLAERGLLAERRKRFQAEWILKRLREDFGRFGIERLGGEPGLFRALTRRSGSPFDQYDGLRDSFLAHWHD